MVSLATMHQIDEPLTNADEEAEGTRRGDRRRYRRSYSRRRIKLWAEEKNLSINIATQGFPALADEIRPAGEKAADIAYTDNESETKDDENKKLKSQLVENEPSNSLESYRTSLSQMNTVRSGSTKRVCITAYSEQQQHSTTSPLQILGGTERVSTGVVPMNATMASKSSVTTVLVQSRQQIALTPGQTKIPVTLKTALQHQPYTILGCLSTRVTLLNPTTISLMTPSDAQIACEEASVLSGSGDADIAAEQQVIGTFIEALFLETHFYRVPLVNHQPLFRICSGYQFYKALTWITSSGLMSVSVSVKV